MVYLIAQYDGLNAVLMFHVEQTPPRKDIQFRCRWPKSSYVQLKDWSSARKVSRLPVLTPLADASVPIEVQWRFADEQGWEDCQPAEFDEAVADFEIEFLEDRPASAERVIEAMSMVDGFPSIYRMVLPDRDFFSGEKVVVSGLSMEHGPGQYFSAGKFRAVSKRMIITGLGSQATLRNVQSAFAGKSKHCGKACVIKSSGSLSPDELAEFVKQKEVTHAC